MEGGSLCKYPLIKSPTKITSCTKQTLSIRLHRKDKSLLYGFARSFYTLITMLLLMTVSICAAALQCISHTVCHRYNNRSKERSVKREKIKDWRYTFTTIYCVSYPIVSYFTVYLFTVVHCLLIKLCSKIFNSSCNTIMIHLMLFLHIL